MVSPSNHPFKPLLSSRIESGAGSPRDAGEERDEGLNDRNGLNVLNG
jgi:hypothetical protein